MSSRKAAGATSNPSKSRQRKGAKTLTIIPSISSSQTATETTHSPLSLRGMPAEIREKIWTMALGERQIHIDMCLGSGLSGSKRHLGHPFIEDVKEIPSLNVTDVKDLTFQIKVGKLYEDTRFNCGQDRNTHMQSTAFSLLLVDRQISKEATFVLYNKNVFCFYNLVDFARFLRTLEGKQRSYLKTVLFTAHRNLIPWKQWPREVPFPRFLALDSIHTKYGSYSSFMDGKVTPSSDLIESQILEAFQEIIVLVERMGWSVKKLPVALTCSYDRSYPRKSPGFSYTRKTAMEELKSTFEKIGKEQQVALQRIKAIAEANGSSSNEVISRAASMVRPAAAGVRKAKTWGKRVQQEHEIVKIFTSQRGQGRGGPVIYYVKWADDGILGFRDDWVPYKTIQRFPKLLADFHRQHPDSLRHKDFKMPIGVERESV